MKGLFWVLALFGLAVAASLGARLNEGYVLLILPTGRMEISLNLFIVAGVLLFAALILALRTAAWTLGLPGRVREYRERTRREKAAQIFQDAVRLLFEGRFGQALKKASASYSAGEATGLSALVAARAAQRMRETGKQQSWLERARSDDPRTEAAALMLEAEMLNEERRFTEAAAVLKRFQEKHGRHLAALRLELRAKQGSKDWDGALKAVRQLEKRAALPPEIVREVKQQAHLANIATHADTRSLTACLKAIPPAERSPRLVAAAARRLIALDDESRPEALAAAQSLIETALDGDAGEAAGELITLYGQLDADPAMPRIARAEHWLKAAPANPVLLLALGRLCLRERLWGKAQSYLEASLSLAPTRDVHLELAQLFDHLERREDANRHYRKSVEEAFGLPPAPSPSKSASPARLKTL